MSSIMDLIGNTPMVQLQSLPKGGRVFVKLESRNPGGSVKDRIARQMLLDLKDTGKLTPNARIIEATSGNTGVGLAMCCAAMHVPITICMPETMSIERRKLMSSFGATLVLTPGPKGMPGAIEEMEKLAATDPNFIVAGQFINPSNPKAHVLTTGPEIIKQVEELKIVPKYFVAGVGTGGTITGVSKVLKSKYENLKSVAVEPFTSAVLSGEPKGPHGIQGIGAGFVPQVLDRTVIDEIVKVKTEEAYEYTRLIAKQEGILVGISAGAAIKAAIMVAEREKTDVIVIAPDSGERYLSIETLF